MEPLYNCVIWRKWYFIIGIALALQLVVSETYAQKIYATSQTNSVSGICLLCGVVNPNDPISNVNMTDYSSFAITVGLLGVSVEQTLIFPSVNTNTGCDSAVINVGSDNSLLTANLFAGITIESFNGSTPNNDAVSASGLVVRLLNANTLGQLTFRPTKTFDRVKVTLTSTLVGALQGLRIYSAYYAPQSTTTPQITTNSFTICEGATATLTASTTEAGGIIDWYDAATGGNLLFTGTSYTVSPTSTKTYYASTRVAACGTITRVPVTVTVNPAPVTPTVSVPATVCPLGSAQLQVTNPQAGVTYNWYSNLTDLIALGTGTTYNTLPLLANTTFYLDAQVNATGCKLPGGKQAVNVTVKNIALPIVANTNITVCQGDTVNLNASTPDSGADIRYFDALTGGLQLFTGNNVKIVPSVNTTLYATAGVGSCLAAGTRIGININVQPRPVVPNITVPLSVCQGTPAVINILNPQIGATYSLYNSLVGGSELASGTTSITTAVLNNDTTLYLDAKLPSVACGLVGRIAVNIKVKKMPLPTVALTTQTICEGDTATLGASTGDPNNYIQWFNTASGGVSLFTGDNYRVVPAVNTTYYASVVSPDGCIGVNKVGVTVNVKPRPITPNITVPVSICAGNSAIINILNPQVGVNLNLFDSTGNLVSTGTGASITTPILNRTTKLFLNANLPSSNCNLLNPVTVTVNVLQVNPATVSTTAFTICAGATANLTATTSEMGGTIEWYDAATGGNLIGTGSPFAVTPAITTTYYAGVKVGACTSLVRVPVTVTVNPVAVTPTITGAAQPICEGSKANLSVSSPQAGVEYSWFNVATGGTALSSNQASYTTANLSATTTYYVEAKVTATGCGLTAGTRVPVIVTVNPAATVPTIAGAALPICEGTNANLSVVSPQAGVEYAWFTVATGGPALANNQASYTTANLSATTTYYVEAKVTATGCGVATGTRTSVIVTVNPAATIPTIAGAALPICEGTNANLSVSNPQPGVEYSWFSAATGGTALASNQAGYTTPNLSATTTYYVEAKITATGCGLASGTRLAVTVTVNPAIAAPIVTGAAQPICEGTKATLTVSNPQAGIEYSWFNVATGGTALANNQATFITPDLSATTTYYVEAKSTASGCLQANGTRTQVVVTVNPAATSPIVSGAAMPVCEGSNTILSVTNPQTDVEYSWFAALTGGTALATNQNSYTTPNLTSTTTYYLDAQITTTGCGFVGGKRFAVEVTVKQPALPTIAGASSPVCPNMPVTLTATPGEVGAITKWYNTSTGGTELATGPTFTFTSTVSTTYYVEATAGSCTSPNRVSVDITVLPSCIPTGGNDTLKTRYMETATINVLSNDFGGAYSVDPATLDLDTSTAGRQTELTIASKGKINIVSPGTVLFTPADGFTGTFEAAYNISNTNGDELTPAVIMLAVGPNAIKDQATAVENTAITIADITSNDIDEDGINKSTVDLDPNTPGIQTSITTEAGSFVLQTDHTIIFTPATNFLGTARIMYLVEDEKGISSYPTELTVTVSPKPIIALFIPQGFSPNGDGVNDNFVIQGIDDYDVSFYVYNRWGNMIFGEKHFRGNWDGSMNNTQDPSLLGGTKINAWGNDSSPEGTYFYVLEFNNSNQENKSGFMVISR